MLFSNFKVYLDVDVLRKTFAYRVYDMNRQTDKALHDLSKILNHSSVSTKMDYIGITAENLEQIYMDVWSFGLETNVTVF